MSTFLSPLVFHFLLFSTHALSSSSLPQFKLPTSAPPTSKPIKVITTPTTTMAAMTTTTTTTPTTTRTTISAAPVTLATTQDPITPPTPSTPPTTTTDPETTTSPITLPPQPASSLPSTTPAPTTAPPPGVTTRQEKETAAGQLAVVTQSDTEVTAAAPSAAMVAMELLPVTVADGLSGDLEHVMPLTVPPHDPDSSPLELVTKLPPSDTQDAEGALSLSEPPTPASADFPLSTHFPVGKAGESELPFNLDMIKTPTQVPTQDSQIEAGSPGSDPEVFLWPKEKTEAHVESAVQSENDTATFSAATVLSGDGEVDHAPPSYAHLLDIDSELDYQYDPDDTFLPVSSAAALLLHFLLLPFLLLVLLKSLSSLLQLSCSDWTSAVGTQLKQASLSALCPCSLSAV